MKDKHKVVFSHPTGNANSRAAASGLLEADLLTAFYTTIASFPGTLLDALGNLSVFSEIHRRRYDPSLRPVTKMFPWIEVARLLSSRVGLTKLFGNATLLFSIDQVYRTLDKYVAVKLASFSRQQASAVYAYEDGALLSFTKAKALNRLCLYDLPIGYWRSAQRFLQSEIDNWPDWSSTMKGFEDSEEKLAHKDEELQLADRIFVASSFTAKTLLDFPGITAPVEVIPYGFPEVNKRHKQSVSAGTGPLRLLFVGGLSQRKGIAQLFAAVEAIGQHVQLTLVGRKATEDCAALNAALAKHNWIPSLPHHLILELMREHDVMIFPSLFEGFGLVITEAMSQGTPVITTERTCGPDFIEHGRNGWLVEAGSSTALERTLDELLNYRANIIDAGKEAMETARLRPWKVYSRELAEAVAKAL